MSFLRFLSFWFVLAAFGAPLFAQYEIQKENVVEREATKKARESGFADLEIDNLHGEIGDKVKNLFKYGGIRPFPDEKTKTTNSMVLFTDMVETADSLPFIIGKDREGKTYLRIRLLEGFSYSTDVFPVQYISRAHCYIYTNIERTPGQNGGPEEIKFNGMEKIIFQFYRINYSGTEYNRELRRMVHPRPIDQAQAREKPIGVDLDMLKNSELTLEMYQEASDARPVWEGPDGVPVPDLTIIAKEKTILHDDKDPIPYDKQVRILNRYKNLLRRINFELQKQVQTRGLDRAIRIENIMDFGL